MRRPTLLTAGMLILAAAGAQAQQVNLKIAYINSQSVLERAPGYQEALTQFNQEIEGYQAELQGMAQRIDSLVKQYEQQQLTLAPDAQQRRQQEIVQAQQEATQRQQQFEQQANQRQQELAEPIMTRINQVIESIRVEGNYSLIFDVAVGSILAADESLDLTEEVVRRLQAQAGNGSGTPGGG